MKDLLNKKKINLLISKLRNLSLKDLSALKSIIDRVYDERLKESDVDV